MTQASRLTPESFSCIPPTLARGLLGITRSLHFMPIHVSLHHVTHYRYDKEIALGPHTVRLRPAPHSRSKVLAYSLRITPAEHFLNWQQDPQSNYLARLVFPEKTKDFRVEVDLVVEMTVFNPFDFFLEADAELEGGLRGLDELTLVQIKDLVKYVQRRDRRLADADRADFLGLDEADVVLAA